jgi:hypothetical protein
VLSITPTSSSHGWKLALVLRIPAAALATLAAAHPMAAQVTAFSYDSNRVSTGRAYEYVKSNRDGTHPTQVTVYVAAADRLESLKWDSGGDVATLVTATIDWERFSVRSLEARRLRRDGPDVVQGTLSTDADRGGLLVSFAPDSVVPIRMWPWHSYDFDFASLAATLPHLVDPEGGFVFARMDVVYRGDEIGFAELGPVDVTFERRETRAGWEARRYRIAGPGLAGMAGTLWTDRRDGTLLEYELPIPDEPGFIDGRLRLVKTLQLQPADWERYQRSKVSR